MNLYLVHCGFYDENVSSGLYESHVNYFVAAEDFKDARIKAKQIEEFKSKHMHIDGVQEISAVDGFRISLAEDSALAGKSDLPLHKHRQLAPQKPAN